MRAKGNRCWPELVYCESRFDLDGLSVARAAMGGNRGVSFSSGREAGLEPLLELRRGTGGTGGKSSSTGLGRLRDASEPMRLGSSIPPTVSIAANCGAFDGALGIGLVQDSPAVETDAPSSTVLDRSFWVGLLTTAAAPSSSV